MKRILLSIAILSALAFCATLLTNQSRHVTAEKRAPAPVAQAAPPEPAENRVAPSEPATQTLQPSGREAAKTDQPHFAVASAPMVKTQAVINAQKPPPKKKIVQDPLAREALALVGTDPAAEEYWFEAIHDPSLPKSERQDLIDDLNEDGLQDPKHPTPEELPLILNRLDVLEALVPTLGDDLEWKEAYSDLENLAEVSMGGGKPVQ